jgi:lipopolysaccharide heptosyltransferase II
MPPVEKVDLKDGDRLLISRTDRLGDLVLALPFVETMKRRYPKCSIEVLASLYASPILENNPHVDRIMRIQNDMLRKDKLYKKDLLHKIKLGNYKAVVVLFPERRISQLFHKADIPVRIGTAGRFHSLFFNVHLLHSRKSNKKHESDFNLDFLAFFKNGSIVYKPRVYLLEKELNNARRILAEANVEFPFVVLHPGSGGSAEYWPISQFIELYGALDRAGINVVISGSVDEGEACEKIAKANSISLKKITGRTDLRTLAAALSLSDVVVANSTGPLHLATALDTQVVGLYPSKTIMSPRRWGPLGNNDIVIVPETEECRCPDNQCTCMETISVESVFEAVTSLHLQRQIR